MNSAIRIRVLLSDEGGNSVTMSYLAPTKARAAAVVTAANVLGLTVEEFKTIPEGTKLYSGRYSKDGDVTFTLSTLGELSGYLSDIARATLKAEGNFEFDSECLSVSISLAGTVGKNGELAVAA